MWNFCNVVCFTLYLLICKFDICNETEESICQNILNMGLL